MLSRLSRGAGPSLGEVLEKAFAVGAQAFAWAFGMAAGAIAAQRVFGVEIEGCSEGPEFDEDEDGPEDDAPEDEDDDSEEGDDNGEA